MDYYFSDPTHFLAGWVGFGAGLWVGPNKSTYLSQRVPQVSPTGGHTITDR
jgi:hypothetical protein